ncbi:MAG: hydroxymyristoyl-ACP dehydratase [Legionella sp.]|jgi:3-hydroxymyristoyl/3-hydroxydecanoyl-(acyl carrier protein) dehydratase|nr:hydroxymyristoyl-ACP dehydratase [Legionella sp.]
MHFLFVDRILALTPGGVTQGIKHVTPDDYYLCLDEQNRRYFVPSLVGETVGQLAAWNVMMSHDFTKRPVAGIAERATLHRPVYVGETLQLEATLDALDDSAVQYHGTARVGDEVVFELTGALGPLLPMDDFIDVDVVRAQFDELNLNQPEALSDELLLRAPFGESSVDKLHHVNARVQFDRILEHEPGVCITAEKCITRAAPYFPDHFPKKPVLPMTILLECVMNLGRYFVDQLVFDKAYRVQCVQRIKMSDFVTPGAVLSATLKLKSQHDGELVLSCRVSNFGKRVCVLELVMVEVKEIA